MSISVGSLTEQDIADAPTAKPGTRLGVSSFTGSGFGDVIKGLEFCKKNYSICWSSYERVSTIANLVPHPAGKLLELFQILVQLHWGLEGKKKKVVDQEVLY